MVDDIRVRDWGITLIKKVFFQSNIMHFKEDLTSFVGSPKYGFKRFKYFDLTIDALTQHRFMDNSGYVAQDTSEVQVEYIRVKYYQRYFEIYNDSFYIETIITPIIDLTKKENNQRYNDVQYTLKELNIDFFDYYGDFEKIRNVLCYHILSIE